MHNKKIATNTFYQIVTKILTSGSGFVITILIARYFGARGYGEFAKITAFVSLFYLIADFGLNAIFLQLEEKEARFSHLLSLRLLLSLVIVILVNSIILFLPFNRSQDTGFPPSLRLGSFIFSLTIIFQAILLSSSAIFQKKFRYDLYMLSVGAGTLFMLLLVFIFSIMQKPLELILFSYVIGSAVSSVISILVLGENIKPFSVNADFSKKILKDSLPLALMLFFNLVYFRIDIIILSLFKSTIDVALYGYAYKYFEFLLAIPLFLSNAIYPLLLQTLKNLRKYYEISQKYLLIFFLFSIAIAIPAWIFAPFIAIVKKDFIPSVLVFKILLLSLPVFFLTNILQWILITRNKKAYLLKIYILAAIINMLLNLLFIPKYSYIASAIITGVSEALILILLFYKFTALKFQETKKPLTNIPHRFEKA
jgi:O-antigen/teichoic acid export membrane protein